MFTSAGIDHIRDGPLGESLELHPEKTGLALLPKEVSELGRPRNRKVDHFSPPAFLERLLSGPREIHDASGAKQQNADRPQKHEERLQNQTADYQCDPGHHEIDRVKRQSRSRHTNPSAHRADAFSVSHTPVIALNDLFDLFLIPSRHYVSPKGRGPPSRMLVTPATPVNVAKLMQPVGQRVKTGIAYPYNPHRGGYGLRTNNPGMYHVRRNNKRRRKPHLLH